MALLRVPALLGTQTDSNSLGSCRGSSLRLFLPRPTQVCSRGHRVAIASVTEVQRNSRREPTQSSKPSDGDRKKHIPPWRTSWTPVPRNYKWRAPTRDWSNQQHDLRRRRRLGQRAGKHEYKQDKEGDRAESSSKMYATQRTAMASILERLRDLERKLDPTEADATSQDKPLLSKPNADVARNQPDLPLRTLPIGTAGELFLPRPPKNVFSIGNYWSTPDHPIPAPGRGVPDMKFAWEFEENSKDEREEKEKRVKTPSLAELIIPPKQLRQLRTAGMALERPIVVGRLGITDNIADKIIGQWRKSELVKIKCGGPAATNMMKIHKDLERKTGGLVIWRSGSVAILYRGDDYDMVNNVATSLEDKLDGLLVSGKATGSFSNNVKQLKGLPKHISGGTPSLDGNAEIVGAPANVVQNGSERDILAGKLASGFVEGIEPNDVERPREHNVDSQACVSPMGAVNPERDDLHPRKEHTHTPLRPRPNMYPDPFVDRDYELEIDSILETLGPRCKDWTGLTPVPVDADLLPPLIPNFRPPYRLLPYGVRPQLSNTEQTDLRRLIRHIAPHFVLGRNKGHQGLAAAILKLWEKSEVVKIAIKAGVQNTSSEMMAEELKRCTGGVLLGRDRYFITIYRGKDFLPRQIAFAITEKSTMLRNLKAGDELVEGGISTINYPRMDEPSADDIRLKAEQEMRRQAEVEKAKKIALAKELEEKLALAAEKKHKAERDLETLDAMFTPVDETDDLEPLTEEEKYMFRKVGLKMGQFLLMGRRGVFDGVVENMHLHWKHRELVKLIVKERDPVQLQKMARMLECESGGVLIAVESTSKGQAIIIYRGKNYQRPDNLRPENLLNKKKALERSLEMQRRASLTSHISALKQEIAKLKASLSESERAKDELLEAALDDFSSMSSDTKEKGLHEENEADRDSTCGWSSQLLEEERLIESVCNNKKELMNLVNLGPIYRAIRLSNLERLRLRKLSLRLGVGSKFNVGKSNGLVGLARAIRVHFLKHSLAVIGIKHMGPGTSVQDLVHDLEDLTGGVLVSQESNRIIMYRGWPKGEKMPLSGSVKELSPELLAAMEAEEEEDDRVDYPSDTRMGTDTSDNDDDEEDLSFLLSEGAGTGVVEGQSSDLLICSTGAA
ncbi:hypothetical protein GOP47_0005187 [Adiantum capillus-veneris]|uniref:CRM domain-containing protein n=1 Tax=Adiantum capillus-veneris TaxID=13818 RepID=A0A9D4V4V8_ADICA|nr:hypothetical protein GOP47_0005187 [Adiantum capillus-veneris]